MVGGGAIIKNVECPDDFGKYGNLVKICSPK
jgi:hypothetical protein